MKYKSMIILALTIFVLISITGVSAADTNDTAIASEDTGEIDLSASDDISVNNLETNENNTLTQANNEETVSTQTDSEILTDDQYTYSDLREQISSGGNINLTKGTYTYNDGDGGTIVISDTGVINGNGAIIDMAGSTIRAFTIITSGVTIKNLTIKNANYNGNGGAIYFSSSGTVTNCNFTDNSAQYGGAVYFYQGTVTNCNFTNNSARYGGAINMDSGTVTNCNFTNNKATGEYSEGGAIWMYSGSVSNCNFTNNKATGDYARGGAILFLNTGTVTNCNFVNDSASSKGGAVYFLKNSTVTNCNFTNNKATGEGGAVYFNGKGDVTNCNFADNSASQGGAIYSNKQYTTADTCIFKRNSGDNVNTVIYPPTLNVNNFTTVYGSGEKLTFDLKTNSSIPVTNGNISISVYFKGNGEWVRNYTCLSGEGWIPDLPVGSYIAVFYTEYAEFQKINRTVTITAPEHTFWFLNYTINGNDNPVIELSNDFYFDPAYDAAFVNGIVINRTVTIKGNGNAIDAKRQARIFYVQSENAVLENLTLKNAHSNSEGGAVYFSGTGEVTNCNFTNNTAGEWGGAIRMSSGTVTNCNFTNNSARYGGAIDFEGSGTVTNCNFVNNTASSDYGGAIYFSNSGSTHTVENCNFTNNHARFGGAIEFDGTGTVTNCNFTNNSASNSGGAIYFSSSGSTHTVTNCNFTGNSANRGGAVYFYNTGTVKNCNFVDNKATGDYSHGGAIMMSSGTVTNCNFTNNTASNNGGAVYFLDTGTVKNCNFTDNTATYGGGAIRMSSGSVENCNFVDNSAFEGGAIFSRQKYTTADTCIFKGNSGDNVNTFIYSPTLNVDNFTTYYGSNEKLTFDLKTNSSIPVTNGNILISVYFKDNGDWVRNYTCLSGEGWIPDLPVGSYIAVFNTPYAEFQPINRTVTITIPNVRYSINVTSVTTNNKTVNITAKSDIPKNILWDGKLLFILPNGENITANYAGNGTWWAQHTFDAYDVYHISATYEGLDNVTVRNATITVNKIKTVITGNAITATYNINKNLVITLKDSEGNILSGVNVIVNLNGAKTYTTDANGQIKISTKGLTPKAYTAKVTFSGNANYAPTSKDIKITVKKAKPKIKAKKKTYKAKAKTKKFTITLKDNRGKAIKNAKVKISVKKITKKAKKKTTKKKKKKNIKKTNKKGKATFKIDRKTKGKYWVTIKYQGNKYFTKATKKVKITLK